MRSNRDTMRWAVALTALFFAPQLALAAPAASAAAPNVVQQGGVPSPKGDGKVMYPMRRTTQKDRGEAAVRAHERIKTNVQNGIKVPAHVSPVMKPGIKGAAAAILDLAIAAPGAYDLYASPNWAFSKLPFATCVTPAGVDTGQVCQKDFDCAGWVAPFFIGPYQYADGETCTGTVQANTGIRKFVNSLPGICTGALAPVSPWIAAQTAPALNCLTLASPDTTSFPGSDYYELAVKDFTQQFHADLPGTTQVRGYYQKNMGGTTPRYLGPLILATENRPVRVKFTNEIAPGAAGNLFIPMDEHLTGVGYGPQGLAAGKFTQNRIAVHLHGGNSPWISDGTQHQWKVPAGDPTVYQQGVSIGYVPDMWWDAAGNPIASCNNKVWPAAATCNVAGASNNPGPGILTYYWTNQQSGRLMWYHDHAYGITRLNAYIGQAAGYLLRSPADEDQLRVQANVPGTLGTDPANWDLAHLIPLVIQEKTFVPPDLQMSQQDPSWDYVAWGGEGNFWLPHVYTPNQWPGNPDNSGNNPFGRWDYGPFFWPVQTILITREGVLRPLTVPCTSAAAVTPANPNGDTECPSTPNPSLTPESFLDTPMVNGTPYPTINLKPDSYRFLILNGSQERNWNLSWFEADPLFPTEVSMVPAVRHEPVGSHLPQPGDMNLCPAPTADNVSPVTGLVPGCWPRAWPVDGRQGGVPDPLTAGPKWVQIGTEGGILPNPAEIVPQPVDYEYNRRNIIVLNIASRGLLLGPAERADVIVDFSAYAGKTMILYNDAPAPVPASDPRQDLYTWDPDFTLSGGAPTTLPGYGPNTRTVMQVVVAANGGSANQVNQTALATVVPEIFNRSQPVLIVPEAEYNSVYQPTLKCDPTDPAYDPLCYTDTLLPIAAQTITYYPMVKRGDPRPANPVSMQLQYKALHELFDTEYGRMNSILAVEIPLTTWLNQTTIPYTNYDPTTEFFIHDQPQVWKTTHNGVDTHTIHYHLINVQLMNRVGWDGAIRKPDVNEMGWKEAVRFNPLEDAFFAVQPKHQTLPWPLRDNWRPYDVDAPLGTTTQFTGVDIYGNPINVVNEVANFGNEYVWHCHLLGHEENDMLRAEVFVDPPEAATNLVVARGLGTGTGVANLSWYDNSLSAITFNVQRANDAAFSAGVINFVANAPATQPGAVTFQDPGPLPNPDYYYRVQASKALTSIAMPGSVFEASSAWTTGVLARAAPIASITPMSIAFAARAVGSTGGATVVTLTNTGVMPLTITSIALSNATEFSSTKTCGASLAVGVSCTATVSFKPTSIGAKTGNLVFTTNDPINPVQNVTLTGTGTAPIATPSTTTIAFGTVAVNQNATQFVTLQNTGTAVLSITSITITTGAMFTRPNTGYTCTASLPIGGTCQIPVRFAPTSTALATGNLRIISNTGGVANTQINLPVYGNPLPANGAVTLTPSLPSPQALGTAVTFTAAGSGSTGLPAGGYQYQFSRNGTVVQAWNYLPTWTLPSTTTSGTYTIRVDVRAGWSAAGASQANRSVSYSIGFAPATAVAFGAITPASPSAYNTAVNFAAATASGSTVGAIYQFQYWLDGAVVRPWSTTATYQIPVGTPGGTHTIIVGASTAATPATADITATTTHTLNYAAATAVSLAAIPAGTATYGASVTFTASGVLPAGLPAGAYYYRFMNGASVLQNWSTSNTLTTSTLARGTYSVTVEVSTAAASWAAQATSTAVPYVINYPTATAVNLTAFPAGSAAPGDSVTFTASSVTPAGLPAGSYYYRFMNGASVLRDWNTSATFTSSTLPLGTYSVTVEVSTQASGWAAQATSAAVAYVIAYPAATAVSLSVLPAATAVYGTSVTFTASGVLPTGLPSGAYYYRFMNGVTVLQNWSNSATFTSTTLAGGNYSVTVEVSTASSSWTAQVTSTAVPYVITYPAATAVSLSVLPAGTAAFGASVTFTASGVLPAGLPVTAYYYRFMNGLTPLQNWSTSPTFTSTTLAAGTYSVTVEASTAASGWTAQATSNTVPYEVNYPVATGVTLTATPAGTAVYGASVTFAASNVQPAGLPAGAYRYRFMNGATELQGWSTSASFTSSAMLGGTYSVTVEVSTANSGWAAQFTSTAVPYVITYPPATGVSVVANKTSPATQPIVFTASGSASQTLPAGAYQYMFWVQRSTATGSVITTVQPYGTSNTWTATNMVAGSYSVVVYVKTGNGTTYSATLNARYDSFGSVPFVIQ